VTDALPKVAVQEIGDLLGTCGGEHVLNVFALDNQPIIESYSALGYTHAWTNVLMHRSLDSVAAGEPCIAIRRISSLDDIEQINGLRPDYPTSARAIRDPHLHDFVATINGRVAAKAQVVTRCPPIAYVSDMFTEPGSRRKGLGSALLRSVHVEARAQEAREMLLVPSLMARQLRFCEGHRCEILVPMVLFILSEARQ
jgi:GNAT superfamily N-acetyltransferase